MEKPKYRILFQDDFIILIEHHVKYGVRYDWFFTNNWKTIRQ
jgi:hypothetical protein